VLTTQSLASDAFTEADEGPVATIKSRVLPIPPLPAGPAPTGALPKALADVANGVRDLPIGARIKAVTDPLVGVPYKLDGLGEGEGYDADPLTRYDAFDCIGLVEEALALAMAGDPVHAAEIRNRLRYGDGPLDYAHRRHFMELQWIPGNVADGFVVDTTANYGATVHMEREITAESWKHWRKRSSFHLTDEQLPIGTMKLDVLPLDVAMTAVDSLPDGAIVLTVRKDVGTPVWISHTGIVVHDADGHTLQRNASRRTGMSVLDEDLAKYLRHLQTYTKWPTAGIAILEPVDPWPRRSAARAATP
jgi:hypothetical protein